MSTYRGVHNRRSLTQQQEMDDFASSVFVWRRFASAVSGNTLAGIAPRRYYQESEARGVWMNENGNGNVSVQLPGGQVAAGELKVSLNVCPGLNDELVYGSAIYRVDAQPMPSKMNGHWMVALKRGDE